jgi:hypothetical protein
VYDRLHEQLHTELVEKVEEFNEKYGPTGVWFRYFGSQSES